MGAKFQRDSCSAMVLLTLGGGGVEVKVKGLVLGNRPFSVRDTIGQKLRHVKS